MSPQSKNGIGSVRTGDSPDPVGTQRLPRGRPWRWLLVLPLVGLASWGAYRLSRGEVRPIPPGENPTATAHAPRVQQPEPRSPEERVEVAHPRQGGMEHKMVQNGSIQPFEYSTLYAKASGYLSVLNVDIGDRVEPGQLLAELDVPELHKAVEQAQAQLDQMQARRKQATARLDSARASVTAHTALEIQSESQKQRADAAVTFRKKVLDRITDLANRNSVERQLVDEETDHYEVSLADQRAAVAGVMLARAQLEEARAAFELARADIENADAQVRLAQADLAKAQVLASYTRITSPYAGVITQRGFHKGDFIRSAADAAGVPLLTVASTDTLRVIVQVPERDVPLLDVGDSAKIEVDALGRGRVFEGKVSRIANAEDPRDRTMRAEVDLPNKDGDLYGGMYGYVTIVLEPGTQGLTIPSSALLSESSDGRGKVFTVSDNIVHERVIQIGRDNGVELEVQSGLTTSDLVITRGAGMVSEGSRVVSQEAPAVAAVTNVREEAANAASSNPVAPVESPNTGR